MTEEQKKQAATDRWHKAAHAMQSGVVMEMHEKPGPTQPNHLRVGVNTALADRGSLVRLLISKGVFTELEYLDAIAAGMEIEVAGYEARLSETYGTKVTLA
jgi:hypothetical protein